VLVEEAQTLSERSLALLRPTIRKEESEIWFSWNPRLEKDAVDKFLRKNKPDNAIVVQANWRDNPWFPDVLEAERQHDLKVYPERYDHIWEGSYARAFEGAYFARQLNEARKQKRIGFVAADQILPIRAFFISVVLAPKPMQWLSGLSSGSETRSTSSITLRAKARS
jgi:phage terminase large subunit